MLLDQKIRDYLKRNPGFGITEPPEGDKLFFAYQVYSETFPGEGIPGTYDVADENVILDFIAYCFEQGKPFHETPRGKEWLKDYRKMLDDGVVL